MCMCVRLCPKQHRDNIHTATSDAHQVLKLTEELPAPGSRVCDTLSADADGTSAGSLCFFLALMWFVFFLNLQASHMSQCYGRSRKAREEVTKADNHVIKRTQAHKHTQAYIYICINTHTATLEMHGWHSITQQSTVQNKTKKLHIHTHTSMQAYSRKKMEQRTPALFRPCSCR